MVKTSLHLTTPPDAPEDANNYDLSKNGYIKPTYMARLFLRFDDCLKLLGIDTTTPNCLRKMESMAIFVHESMSISSRNYHSVQHVFEISKNMTDPIAILAALFHDCIYYHVDGEFSSRQKEVLTGAVITNNDSSNCLLPASCNDDYLLSLVMSIFGFQNEQELTPMTGLNEFLSAVIAVRKLQPLLSTRQLAEIACCIEATIPFRRTSGVEGSPMDCLYKKMELTNKTFSLDMTDSDLVVAVQRATLLSNNDLENFGTDDRACFLDNTWSLLPESNIPLRHHSLFTVEEFQHALVKMYRFFSFLQPYDIFHSFRGVPRDDDLDLKFINARRNIEIGHRYVGAKLLSISILAAIAEWTGGDAPVSMFMGDLPVRGGSSVRLGDMIPMLNVKAVAQLGCCDMDVYDLLVNGRRSESAFDIRQSPLAAYFYGIMGDDKVNDVLTKFNVYPMTRETAKMFLHSLPAEAVCVVAKKMITVAPSRSLFLHEMIKSLNR